MDYFQVFGHVILSSFLFAPIQTRVKSPLYRIVPSVNPFIHHSGKMIKKKNGIMEERRDEKNRFQVNRERSRTV
jgi:hypothetical protein